MSLEKIIKITKQKSPKIGDNLELFRPASEEPPLTGLPLQCPILEFLFDRPFIPYGRIILVYGKAGSSKTSFFYDLAKRFQRQNGTVLWVETENAIDFDYAQKQGVDLNNVGIQHPTTLEEGLNIIQQTIKLLAKEEYKDPVLICYDSIASSPVAIEEEKSDLSQSIVGYHARVLSRFFREIVKPLQKLNCTLLMLNQPKHNIMAVNPRAKESIALIGGEAQYFHATYIFELSKINDILDKEADSDAVRHVGSLHRIKVIKNKLGRSGKTQVEVPLYINGGYDWTKALVTRIVNDYPQVIKQTRGYYMFVHPELENLTYKDGEEWKPIPVNKNMRYESIARIIDNSPDLMLFFRALFKIKTEELRDEET